MPNLHFTTDDGLPSMEVYDVYVQDGARIWFATDRGACSYDGVNFNVYTQKDGLSHDCVLRITADPKGRLWFFGLDRSLSIFDGDSFQPYCWSDTVQKQVRPGIWIHEIDWDSAGNLMFWYQTQEEAEIFRVNDISGEIVTISNSDASGHPPLPLGNADTLLRYENLLLSAQLHSKYLLRGGIQGQIFYTDIQPINTLTRIDLKALDQRDTVHFKSVINSLYLDPAEDLWLCTNEGLFRYAAGNLRGVQEQFFPGLAISRIVQDARGGYWVTTLAKGVFYVPSMAFHKIPAVENALGEQAVIAMRPGVEGLYIASQEGGLFLLDSNNHFRLLLQDAQIFQKMETMTASKHGVSAGKYHCIKNGLDFQTEKMFSHGAGGALFRMENGNYFSANYSAWEIRDTANTTSLKLEYRSDLGRVSVFLETKDKVYVGGSGGLFSYDKAKGELQREIWRGIPFTLRVSDLVRDAAGNLWVSTLSRGLLCKTATGLFHVGEAQGLSSHVAHRLAGGEPGTLWVATNRGLTRLRYRVIAGQLRLDHVAKITSREGLPSNYVRDIACWQGQVFIASDFGLHHFDPALPDQPRPAPALHLTEVLVNGQAQPLQAPLVVPAGDVRLEIAYASFLPMHSTALPAYRYRLRWASENADWQYSAATRQYFSNLQAGAYTFEVQARDPQGEWAKTPLQLSFSVQGAIWQRMRWLVVGLLALLAFAVVHKFKRQWAHTALAPPTPAPMAQKPPPGEAAAAPTAPAPQPDTSGPTIPGLNRERSQIVLPSGQGYQVIQLADIQYLEANGNYTLLHLRNGQQRVLSQTLSLLEQTLPDKRFFRIHKSYLVNSREVEGYESGRGGQVFLRKGPQLPIAVRRKAAFISHLKENLEKKVSVHKK